MAGELEGSGAEDTPGVAAAGGGGTLDATSEDADAAGAGGRHGWEEGKERRFPAGGKTWGTSHLEWDIDRGVQGLWSGKNPGGGVAREW